MIKKVTIPKPKEPLRFEETVLPSCSERAVLVKVMSAGVCHTDLHLWEGGYHGAPGVFIKYEDRGVVYPVTPGHEISGIVETVGPEVTDIKVGEKVIVYPWIGCGHCPVCRRGDENFCEKPRSIGFFWTAAMPNIFWFRTSVIWFRSKRSVLRKPPLWPAPD